MLCAWTIFFFMLLCSIKALVIRIFPALQTLLVCLKVLLREIKISVSMYADGTTFVSGTPYKSNKGHVRTYKLMKLFKNFHNLDMT